MSSKFHKSRQKAQWSASGIRVSQAYLHKLECITDSPVPGDLKSIASSLLLFSSLQNTYTELEALKRVCTSVTALSRANIQITHGSSAFEAAASLVLELLFFANSKPLHRQILSWCKGFPPDKFALVMPRLVKLVTDAIATFDVRGSDMQPITIAEPLLSLLESKPFQPPLRDCSIAATRCLSNSMHEVIKAACDGAHIPPSVMHSAQDAIAAIYYLLELHGSFMAESGADGHAAICAAAEAMITSLKGSMLAREAMASAAVALFAAAVLPSVPPQVTAHDLALGLFCPTYSCPSFLPGVVQMSDKGIVAQQLSLRGSSLAEEMKQFSFYGRVCAMKGFLQALPKEVLCSKLHMQPAAAPSAPTYPTSPSSCSALQQSNIIPPALSSLSVLAHPPQTDSTASPSTASVSKDRTAAVQASHMRKTDAQRAPAEINAADDFTLGKHQTFESKSEEPSEQGFAHVALPVSQDRASTTGTARTAGAAGTAHIAGAAGTAGSVWMLLSDGALPACCAAVQQSTDAHHKFHAVSALAFCLDRIKQCLQDHAAAHSAPDPAPPSQNPTALQAQPTQHQEVSSSADDSSVMPILAVTLTAEEDEEVAAHSVPPADMLPIVSEAMQLEVMHLFWANFEDSLVQTVRQVQAAFETLLDILQLQTQVHSSVTHRQTAASELQTFLCSTSSTLLAIGSHRKGRYIPLAALVPRVGAKQMLSLQPDLLKQTLLGMQDDAVGSSAATLLTQLLLHLKSAMFKDSGSQAEGLTAWRALWIPVILQGLRSSNEHLRHRVALYAVPVPLALDQASVLPLLQQVVQLQPGQHAATDSQVATLVAILKTARQMGLYQDLSHVVVPGEGSVAIPEGLLHRAVASSTESLQVDALQLACVHPRPTSLPGSTELALVRQAIVVGLRCTSTSMRNKWTGLLPKLLRRIFMSVHAALNRQRSAAAKTGRGPHVEADLHAAEDLQGVQRQADFMHWLSQKVLASLYPGGPYERKYLAMLLLNALLEVWNAPDGGSKAYTRPSSTLQGDAGLACNVGTLVIGQHQFQAFCQGFFDAQTVRLLLGSAVDSWDRMRDGAVSCLMKLPAPLPGLDTPQALLPHLRWTCHLLHSPRVRESDAGSRLLCMVYEKYVMELGWHIELFPVCTAALPQPDAPQDKGAAAALVLLQSLAAWLQADIKAGQQDLYQACRQSLAHGVLLLLHYLAPLIPWQDAAVDPGQAAAIRPWLQGLLRLLDQAMDLVLQPLSKPQESNIGAEDVDADDVEGGEADFEGGDLAPQSQVILTGCWLTMKEISLLLGIIASCAPLPGGHQDSQQHLLEPQELAVIGQRFLHILTTMKHNGALDKTQDGFTALVKRMLLEASPQLNSLPQLWLNHLLAYMQREGQSRDDIVRRSAGLPAAFVAVFTAEPTGHPKTLLQQGMMELLRVAADESQTEAWPRVHAINTLRLTFNDKNLANDVSGFFAQGLQVAVVAMASSAWEVRNAASLIFTALLIRMLGFRNLVKGESARRAITGAEFFNRFPSLHTFLLTQLQAATRQLQHGGGVVHPSLFPVLALLSRLRPSLHNKSSLADDPLSPACFTEAVQKCATASHMAVRQLAARALASLIPPEELAPMLQRLLSHVNESWGSSSSSLNVVHGCLLQAKLLMEINAQTLDTAPLLDSLLPLLQSTLPLMHPTQPCAPIRNEVTLLAAAVVALPGLPQTTAMACLLRHLRQLCQLAVAHSCGDHSQDRKQWRHVRTDRGNDDCMGKGHSSVNENRQDHQQAPDEHVGRGSYDSTGEGHSRRDSGDRPPLQGGNTDPADPLQCGGANSRAPLQCDDTNPMASLWLKNATLLLFGHDLQLAFRRAVPDEEYWEAYGLREEEAQTALQSRSYDVRAACLKACIQRLASGETMPSWLPTRLKQCLVTERHHKVLRRLLHLLATIPSNPPLSETVPSNPPLSEAGSQPETSNTYSCGHHQQVKAQQHTNGNDAHTIAPGAAMLDKPNTVASSSLLAPAAPWFSSPITSSPTGTQPSAAPTAAPCPAATVTAAVQQYEQISSVVTQARHPSVKREGLQCLGGAVHSVIAALMPSKGQHPQQQSQEQSQQHSQQNFLQQFQAAVAHVGDAQPSDSQHLTQDSSAQELAQTDAESVRHEQLSRENSGSEEAQLRSPQLREAKLRDSHSRSDSGLDSACSMALPSSRHPPQMSGRAQFEHEASEAQQAQREDQQTAYNLVDGFVDLVSTYSKAQQFDDMRLAAATALAVSGLLCCQSRAARRWQGSFRLTAPATQAWFVVISMMEDEDSEVRDAASGAAAAALEVLCPGSLSRGAHVELTLRHTFHMLGSCCMHLPAVQRYMTALVYRPDSLQMGAEQHHVHNTGSSSQLHDCPITEAVSELQGAPGGPASSSEAGGINQHDCKRTEGMSNSQSVQTCATGSRHEWQSSSVGKLFDKELDNHHEEKLLLAQIAARELRAAAQGSSSKLVAQHSVVWARRTIHDLTFMVGVIKQLQAGDELQGEVFNNDSIFQLVYQMLLALHTAAFCCLLARTELPSVLSGFQQAAEELSEVTLHPVLAAMLAITTAEWNASEAEVTRKELSGCGQLQWAYSFLSGDGPV